MRNLQMAQTSAPVPTAMPRVWAGRLVLVVLLVTLIAITVDAWPDDRAPDTLTLLSFAPHVVLSVYLIWKEVRRRAFSLHMMHALFAFLFFGVAAEIQFLVRHFPLSDYYPMSFGDDEVLWANVMICIWFASYLIGHRFMRARSRARVHAAARAEPISGTGLLAGFVASMGCLLVLAAKGSFGVMTRAGFDAVIGTGTGTESIVTGIFVRGIPVVTLLAFTAAAADERRHRIRNIAAAAILGLGTLAFNNPLGAPRFWTAMVFIGFAAVLLLRRVLWRWILVPIIVFGVVFAMPILDRGRNAIAAGAFLEGSDESLFQSLSEDGDYDAFGNLALTMRYVNEVGPTWGRQLAGTLAFFVPRSMWPDKPVGSGFLVATRYALPNENISSPLPAEGIINFGVLGVVLFGFACGAIIRRVDDRFAAENSMVTWRALVYSCWLGLFFFVCRGDLMSSVAYTVGTTCAALPLRLRLSRKVTRYRYAANVPRAASLPRGA